MVILILYLNYIYILLNIFTTRYSSIRIKIIECLINKEKMIDNNWLFDDRNKRLAKTLKSKFILKLISTIIIIFRKSFNKMKVCIVGSSGLIGRNICNNLLKNHFKVIGISRKNSEVSKNFKHIKLDIENDELTYNIIKIVNESDVIIFCLNKKERPKNLEYDINKLIFYHVFFPLRLLKN